MLYAVSDEEGMPAAGAIILMRRPSHPSGRACFASVKATLTPKFSQAMDPSPKASSTVHILIEGHRPLAGLTVDLGYLWMKHQGALRRLVPRWLLLTTPLVQLPLIRTCFRTRDATLLVVWEDAAVSELSWLQASSNIRIDSQVEVIVVRASQPEWSNFLSKQTDQQEQALLLDLVDRVQIRVAELSRKECQPKLRGVLELVLYSSKPCLIIQSADLMFHC